MLRIVAALAGLIWTHPSNRHRRSRAIAKSLGWQIYKRTVRKPTDIKAFGFRFRCYPDSRDASRMIYFNSEPDPGEMEFIRRYLRPGDHVIDAGANVGVYSLLLASLVGPTGRVLAFEPDPKTADRLRENAEINHATNITVRQAAISDTRGTAEFTQGEDTGNTLYRLKTFDRPPQTVEVTTFDSEIAQGAYQLCKMDIEGAELAALHGAANLLQMANPPVWLMELSEKSMARSGHCVADIQTLMAEHGFSLWRYKDGSLIPFVSMPRKPGHVGDGIAIADTALETVRARLAANAG